MPKDCSLWVNLESNVDIKHLIDVSVFQQLSFTRISLSDCKERNWNNIIDSLDYNFLLNLALGKKLSLVTIINKKHSADLDSAVEFIKFCLFKSWLEVKYIPTSNDEYVTYDNFVGYYKGLPKLTKRKLKFLKKYVDKKMGNIYIENHIEKSLTDFFVNY